MWVKLSTDYLNLGEVLRVRFNRAMKNGRDEVVAEVEALIKGELQIMTRVRGADAERIQAVLDRHAQEAGVVPEIPATNTGTLSDL
jgi:hypothetical protein